MKSGKMNVDMFLDRVSDRVAMRMQALGDAGEKVPVKIRDLVGMIYKAAIAELEDVMVSGTKLSLTGFGSFYMKEHKGHPVQFWDETGNINNYMVFKFSASDVLNRRLRARIAEKAGQTD